MNVNVDCIVKSFYFCCFHVKRVAVLCGKLLKRRHFFLTMDMKWKGMQQKRPYLLPMNFLILVSFVFSIYFNHFLSVLHTHNTTKRATNMWRTYERVFSTMSCILYHLLLLFASFLCGDWKSDCATVRTLLRTYDFYLFIIIYNTFVWVVVVGFTKLCVCVWWSEFL